MAHARPKTYEEKLQKVKETQALYDTNIVEPSKKLVAEISELINSAEIKERLENNTELLRIPSMNLALFPEMPNPIPDILRNPEIKSSIEGAKKDFANAEKSIISNWSEIRSKNPSLPDKYEGSDVEKKFEQLDGICDSANRFVDTKIRTLIRNLKQASAER